MTSRAVPTPIFALALALGPSLACLPGSFDALADAAPVDTHTLQFPAEPSAAITVALTVPADDESRGRVLVGDGDSAIAWLRIDLDGRVDTRFASFDELMQIGTAPEPALTGLAVVGDVGVAQGLVRVAAGEAGADRVVRFRVADFSRIDAPELDMQVYPWVADPPPTLRGALASVQLDDGLPEALSASDAGVFVWDALGTSRPDYEQARAQALADDPTVFDADPGEGFGLTRCPELDPIAIAGGRVLAGGGRAAIVLEGETATMIAVADPPVVSLVGAPRYDCARASLSLPGGASTLAVVDLGLDDDDDLLVGAPALGQVWVYENDGDGIGDAPSLVLEAGDDVREFGWSLTSVELGGDAPEVIVVGAPGTDVDGKDAVGRVLVFDAGDGTLLRTIADLDPRSGSRHGLGVHGVDVPGREELVVTGARELRIHWRITDDDEGKIVVE